MAPDEGVSLSVIVSHIKRHKQSDSEWGKRRRERRTRENESKRMKKGERDSLNTSDIPIFGLWSATKGEEEGRRERGREYHTIHTHT